MEFNEITKMIAVFAVPVLFAITLHEAAHGYVARHFGDTTAFNLGRISLNPARHIDLVGTVFLPLVTLFVTGGRIMFGWAKPVPVNFHALRHPKRDMLWVALAGPTANLAMALGWAAVLKIGALSGLAQGDFLIQVPLAGVEVNLDPRERHLDEEIALCEPRQGSYLQNRSPSESHRQICRRAGKSHPEHVSLGMPQGVKIDRNGFSPSEHDPSARCE